MGNQLQLNNTHQSPIVLNDKEKQISSIIYHVNQLTSYPLSDIQIEDWSISINKIRPNQDLEILSSIVSMMKTGAIEYNSRLGIQNIFMALKKYDKIRIGHAMIEKNHWSPNEQFEKRVYYEDDVYPKEMVWEVDKDEYEKLHLKETRPQHTNHFIN